MADNYTVYKHTSPEGKVYIGCTGVDVKKRWYSGYYHNEMFSSDIKRLGWENFNHEILATRLSEKEGYELEKELIHKYNSTNPNFGYNISTGGYGRTGCYFTHTEEAKQKIRETSMKRCHTDETRRKMSESRRGQRNPMYGKRCSEINSKRHTPDVEKRSLENRHKNIMCVETGELYRSVTQAARTIGYSPTAIFNVCDNPNRTAGGYHWIHVNR